MDLPFLRKKFVRREGGQIFYYTDQTFPGRPTVVFIHGLSSNHTTWLNTIERLHRQKINSLAVELRGHGWSDKTKQRSLYRLPVFVGDLEEIIAVEQLSQFFLVGYSFGGPIAMRYAAKHPEKVVGLVLISANFLSHLVYLRLRLITPLVYGGFQLLACLLAWQKRKQYIYYEHQNAKGYWQSTWVGLNTMPLAVNFWMFAELFHINLTATLPKIQAPTLIVRASEDPFFTLKEAEKMIELIPHAELVSPNHSSHFVASRAQAEMTEIILGFVEQQSLSQIPASQGSLA